MEKYECEFYIRPFDFDFEEAKRRVTIKFENHPISYDEALRLYYSIRDSYFTWDFNFNPVILKERKNDFVVVGDGINDVPMFEFADVSVGIGGKLEYETTYSFEKIGDALEKLLCKEINR